MPGRVAEYERKIDQQECDDQPRRACPLCGAGPHENATQSAGLVTCGECGLIYRTRAATAEELAYWSAYSNDGIEQRYDQLRLPYYRVFWRRLSRLPASRSPQPAVLDVGCVPGSLLKEAVAGGWDPHGAELSAELCRITHDSCGATMWEGRIENIDFKEQRFDLIVFSDVFRCVAEPQDALRKCFEILKPRGVVVIREVDATRGKHAARLAKPYPFDMQFFTPRTLRRFLTAAGFEPVRVHNSPMSLITIPRLNRLARSSPLLYRMALAAANGVITLGNPLARLFGRPLTPSFLAVGYRPR